MNMIKIPILGFFMIFIVFLIYDARKSKDYELIDSVPDTDMIFLPDDIKDTLDHPYGTDSIDSPYIIDADMNFLITKKLFM